MNTRYERVVGATPEEEAAALKELQDFSEQPVTSFEGYELEKTEAEKAIMERVENIVDEMVKQWEGDPKKLPLENIHLLKEGAVEETSDGDYGGRGVHLPLQASIGLERQRSPVGLASTLAHELFHLKSYKSAQIKKSNNEVDLYRSGMSMIDRKDTSATPGQEREYFGILEEGIVAECTKRFFNRLGDESMFAKEIEANNRLKNWVANFYRKAGMPEGKIAAGLEEWKYTQDAEARVQEVEHYSLDDSERTDYAAGMFRRLYENNEIESVERRSEREKLQQLCDEIALKSADAFKNSDEVFQKFAQANFTGNYLPIARIIESALGKGAFRRIAIEFSQPPAKEKNEENPAFAD